MPSSEQITSLRRPFRVFCCLVTTLSFVIIVPSICIALGIRLGPGGELSYTRNVQDAKNTDRTVRRILDQELSTTHLTERYLFVLSLSQPISDRLPWLWSGTSTMIAVFAIVPKSTFSLMRESFHLKLLKTIIYRDIPAEIYLRQTVTITVRTIAISQPRPCPFGTQRIGLRVRMITILVTNIIYSAPTSLYMTAPSSPAMRAWSIIPSIGTLSSWWNFAHQM